MHCPFCSAPDTRVIDSRLANDGDQVRRRRECVSCSERFTTYESAELNMPRIVKQDGSRMPFKEEKLCAGVMRALEKRPVSTEQIDAAINNITHQLLAAGEREHWIRWLIFALHLCILIFLTSMRFAMPSKKSRKPKYLRSRANQFWSCVTNLNYEQ